MHPLRLTAAASLAAFALPSSPAAAQQGGWADPSAAPQHQDVARHHGDGEGYPDWREDRRDFRRFVAPVYVAPSWNWDANRSFDPNRWNDWWHDRPDRAYPRWMQNNQNCERIWWSGGGWRC